ncbi:madf domain transcription factor [Holotrichia oblita]|nr:madf domain transcription factor [Holotrichia oblita]
MIMRELRSNDPREYRAVMRITPQQFDFLLSLIAPKIQRTDTFMREAIPARVKLEVALAYLASGTTFRKIIVEVCDAISESLKEFIKYAACECS